MNRKALIAAAFALGLATVGGVATVENAVEAGDRAIVGCVAAPLDGGTDCKRKAPGRRISREAVYFGAGNSFPAREAVGTCVPMPDDSCSGGP